MISPHYATATLLLGRSIVVREWQPDHPRRPSLPSELVLYIFRLCSLSRRDPSRAHYLPWLQEQWKGITVSTWEPERQYRLLCVTPPLSGMYLEQIHKFRLRTLSKDYDWFSETKIRGWSWFDIGIVQRLAASEANAPSPGKAERTEVKLGSDAWGLSPQVSDEEAELDASTGKPLRWRSHSNEMAGRSSQLYTGDDVGPEHEIWNYLQPGDRLGVWIDAPFGGWSCYGKHVDIEVWEHWEPSWM
ncbi:hypothetical protein FRB95_005704 [Tulasnella sp. JGI-2019a]|nr:hypothetical protein FRB95_005704 [Tulasnella sp. JGI-2019a]